ncbi:hypothetical protein D9M68_600190 [compost metagenome]
MQFIARKFLIDMARLVDLAVLECCRGKLVTVVGHIHFALADQLPVITVGGAVEHVEVIDGAHTVSRVAGAVVGDLWCTPNPTLTGVVQPGQTRLLDLVDGFMDQQYIPSQPCRCVDDLLVDKQEVLRLVRIEVAHVGRKRELIDEPDWSETAIGLRRGLNDGSAIIATAIAGYMVPEYFHPTLGDRKGVIATLGKRPQTIAPRDRFGTRGALLRRLIDLFRHGRSSVARVDRHAVSVRIALEHRQLAGRQLIFVLLDICRSDDKQWFFRSEGVAEETASIHLTGVRRQATGPGRNTAICIGCKLCPQRR